VLSNEPARKQVVDAWMRSDARGGNRAEFATDRRNCKAAKQLVAAWAGAPAGLLAKEREEVAARTGCRRGILAAGQPVEQSEQRSSRRPCDGLGQGGAGPEGNFLPSADGHDVSGLVIVELGH